MNGHIHVTNMVFFFTNYLFSEVLSREKKISTVKNQNNILLLYFVVYTTFMKAKLLKNNFTETKINEATIGLTSCGSRHSS